MLVASTLPAIDDDIDAFDLNTMSQNSFYSLNDMMNRCSAFMEQTNMTGARQSGSYMQSQSNLS